MVVSLALLPAKLAGRTEKWGQGTAKSTQTVPTFLIPTNADTTEQYSKANMSTPSDPSPSPDLSWDTFPWKFFSGYTVSQRPGVKRKWVWQHGYDVEQSTLEKRRWVCHYCILKTKTVTPYSCAEEGLQNAKSHLWLQHKIWNETEKGPKPTKAGWRNKAPRGNRNIAEAWGLDTTNPREQQIANNYISGFDKAVFQQKFLWAIVVHNLPFSPADSILLRDVFEYCNPLVSRTQAHMSRKTIHSRVLTAYNTHKPKVMEILQRVRGKIHAAFDGWLSNNKKSLYGIVVFYLDENDRPKKLVLGLPEVEEAHWREYCHSYA